RREDATPVQYGAAIARVTEAVFGVSNADTEQSALVRAEMMDYRDARSDGRMRDEDWERIEHGLLRSYESLELGLHRAPCPYYEEPGPAGGCSSSHLSPSDVSSRSSTCESMVHP